MMGYSLVPSTSFKKGLKKYLKNPQKRATIEHVLQLLSENGVQAVPEKMLPHKLKGDYKDCWECHLMPDLLLIWKQYDTEKEILLIEIGSHSDLF